MQEKDSSTALGRRGTLVTMIRIGTLSSLIAAHHCSGLLCRRWQCVSVSPRWNDVE